MKKIMLASSTLFLIIAVIITINLTQKNNNFDCKSLAQKIISLTNGKGGGAINFAQVIHHLESIDYKEVLED